MKTLKRVGLTVLLVSLMVTVLAFTAPSRGISVNVGGDVVSITHRFTIAASSYPQDWYLDANLQNGLWYQDINSPIFVDGYQVSFMKIYSGFEGNPTLRVMELSTYPRAYKDTSPHVYEVDTPFVVTQDDLNDFYYLEYAQQGMYEVREDVEDGTFVYIHWLRGDVRLLGETATHYAGDPLPGSFPMWIESETLPTPRWVDAKESVFPYVFHAVKGELCNVSMYEAVYKQEGDTAWSPVPPEIFDTLETAFTGSDTEIRVNKIVRNKDRTVIRIIYDRIFN